ncbi:energy transducer TonB [Flavobacterium limnophilum]|uniref:energy transducer TonB n=1 Tax=Flavobacterium limnophilum TaxID=3003262 RepID=UPI0022ABDDB0|nr:energy transducer TonB [Flavobacterium limnophilum]
MGGKVYVTFIIEKDGSISDVKVLRDVGFGTGKEAIRVLELCPKWTPGRQNGKNVRCSYSLPISLQANIFKASEVDKKPEFEGGMQNFYEFVRKNYKMPEIEGLKGTVYITLIVEKDGSLSKVKILRDIGYGIGEEALRILKICPNWVPAQHKGQKVRCSYSLSMTLQSS